MDNLKDKNNALYTFLANAYLQNQDRIENPLWQIVDGKLREKSKYVLDFERYIPEEFKYGWNDLTKETKTALFIVANEAAENEEWD
jgi:hypothetical protein